MTPLTEYKPTSGRLPVQRVPLHPFGIRRPDRTDGGGEWHLC